MAAIAAMPPNGDDPYMLGLTHGEPPPPGVLKPLPISRMSSWLWARLGIAMLCVHSCGGRGMVAFSVIGCVSDDVV